MLQILISCLIISSAVATSSGDCTVGPVNFTGFDIDKYLGVWYELYRIHNPGEKDLNCESEHFFKTENGTSIDSAAYNFRIRRPETLNGAVSQVTDKGFNETYPTGDDYWTNYYWILGTDYETYSILRTCLFINEENIPVTWIYSRSRKMSDDTKIVVNTILKNFTLSLDDFESVNQDCGEHKRL